MYNQTGLLKELLNSNGLLLKAEISQEVKHKLQKNKGNGKKVFKLRLTDKKANDRNVIQLQSFP